MEQKKEPLRKLTLEQRSRSVPYRRVFMHAVLFTLFFYLGLVALLTSVVTFFLVSPEMLRGTVRMIVMTLPACGILWAISYLKRRKAHCPLCKCSPFLDSLAHKHEKAFKVWPLNHGTTAVLNVILTQRWRCMYCGTPFDLLKNRK